MKQYGREYEKDDLTKGVQAGSELSSRNTLNKTPTRSRGKSSEKTFSAEPDGPWTQYRPKSSRRHVDQKQTYQVVDRRQDLRRSNQVFKGIPEATIEFINESLSVDPIELTAVAPTVRLSWLRL